MKKYIYLTIAILLCVIAPFFIKEYHAYSNHKKNKDKMQKPDTYMPVSNTLARYCMSVDKSISIYRGAYLPDTIKDFHPVSGYISPNGAAFRIEGFHHEEYGYQLERGGRNNDNIWYFYFFVNRDKELLFTFPRTELDVIPKDEMESMGEKYFNEEIQQKPTTRLIHYERVLFLIDFCEYEKAINACDTCLNEFDNYLWMRLTKALLVSLNNREKANEEFQGWVDSNPSFSAYFDLFYYADRIGDVDMALHSIMNALKQPLLPNDSGSYNIYYYAFFMAKYAYENNHKDIVIKVCDAMIDPSREKERRQSSDEYHIDFKIFKQAIINNNESVIREWTEKPNDFNPYRYHEVPWE